MTKQYYSVNVQDQIAENRNQVKNNSYAAAMGNGQTAEGNSLAGNKLAIRLNDGEIMYVNVDKDGWVEIQFSDNMNKVIKANADYFASYYRR